jgi:DNA-binding transcriptional regulator YiaG
VDYSHRSLVCAECNESYLGDEHAKANDHAWTRAFGKALANVDGSDLRLVRESANMTQAELESVLGLGTNTIARWETGARPLRRSGADVTVKPTAPKTGKWEPRAAKSPPRTPARRGN